MGKKHPKNDGFGGRLVYARRLRSWSQEELADLVGCTPRQISQYETEYREPSIQRLSDLSYALNVSADQLLGHEPLPEPDDYDALDERNRRLRGREGSPA